MDMLKTSHLFFEVSGICLCHDVNIKAQKGKFTGIIGPNGSGKTTLLKQIYGVLKSTQGTIYLEGRDVSSFTSRQRAQNMGVLAQENDTEFPFSVEEIVAMGRGMYHSILKKENEEDRKIVFEVLKQVKMEHKIKQLYSTLSGGEKQRVLLARALAQKANFLIMDEPTNHLDVGHQFQIMEFLKKLDMTILAAIHDLNLAVRFCDELILLNHGKVIGVGSPKEILTKEILKDVFHMNVDIKESENHWNIEFLSSTYELGY